MTQFFYGLIIALIAAAICYDHKLGWFRSAVFFTVATGFSYVFWRWYTHNLMYQIYVNDTYVYDEHFSDEFRFVLAVLPSIALGAAVVWLFSRIYRRKAIENAV